MRRRSKFGNVRIHGFASKREARAWAALALLEKGGLIRNLACQVRFPIDVNGLRVCAYIADFTFWEQGPASPDDWTYVVADAKGYRTREYALKKKLMRAVLGVEIREL